MKLGNLVKTKTDGSDSEDSDESDVEGDAVLNCARIKHVGGVNRIRAMHHPTHKIVATFSDTAKVNIFDISTSLSSLDSKLVASEDILPIHTNSLHKEEGYALDWSSINPGRLLSGCCRGDIYLTQSSGDAFKSEKGSFKGHSDSVEDLQWSPTEVLSKDLIFILE